MIIAVNPVNTELCSEEYPMVYSQGQLLYALEQNACEEILIDRDLPGHLSIDDLYGYIAGRYPVTKISLIEQEPDTVSPQTASPCKFIKPKFISVIPLFTILIALAVYYLLTLGSDPGWMEIIVAGVASAIVGTVAIEFL